MTPPISDAKGPYRVVMHDGHFEVHFQGVAIERTQFLAVAEMLAGRCNIALDIGRSSRDAEVERLRARLESMVLVTENVADWADDLRDYAIKQRRVFSEGASEAAIAAAREEVCTARLALTPPAAEGSGA
jgi:hypothetical protein